MLERPPTTYRFPPAPGGWWRYLLALGYTGLAYAIGTVFRSLAGATAGALGMLTVIVLGGAAEHCAHRVVLRIDETCVDVRLGPFGTRAVISYPDIQALEVSDFDTGVVLRIFARGRAPVRIQSSMWRGSRLRLREVATLLSGLTGLPITSGRIADEA